MVAEVTGYVYSHKRSNIWTCTVRTKEVRCYAAIKKVDGKYQKLGHHKCEARPGIVKKKRIAFESKKLAKSQPFKSTNAIIDDALRRQWIDSKIIPPETWCQFMKSTRTNNDLESWHHRMNKRAMNPNVNFYFLVQVLFNEAQLVEINLRILSVQESRKGYVEKQKLLFEVWNAFIEGNISAGTMHGRCSRLVGCPSNL